MRPGIAKTMFPKRSVSKPARRPRSRKTARRVRPDRHVALCLMPPGLRRQHAAVQGYSRPGVGRYQLHYAKRLIFPTAIDSAVPALHTQRLIPNSIVIVRQCPAVPQARQLTPRPCCMRSMKPARSSLL